jgi:hypothetical protein
VSVANKDARNKVCPLLSLAIRKVAYCQGKDCMFWSETGNPEHGVCELKEYLKKVVKP